MPDLWKEYRAIKDARRKKMNEAMGEYDRKVYQPAVEDLRKRCAEEGHKPGNQRHYNGFGGSWDYCRNCGAQLNIEIN